MLLQQALDYTCSQLTFGSYLVHLISIAARDLLVQCIFQNQESLERVYSILVCIPCFIVSIKPWYTVCNWKSLWTAPRCIHFYKRKKRKKARELMTFIFIYEYNCFKQPFFFFVKKRLYLFGYSFMTTKITQIWSFVWLWWLMRLKREYVFKRER